MGVERAEKLALLGGARPLWLHGVSVGEVQACAPIARAARKSGYKGPIIISTTTETGKAMALRLGEGLFTEHVYYPWDKNRFVLRAVASLRPCCFAAAETELWPNMLWRLKDEGVPSFLVNGRISDRSWKRLSGPLGRAAGREMYGLFSGLLMREERDAERLLSLGVAKDRIKVCGDSKIDALLARRDLKKQAEWKARLGSPERKIFLAGSTHEGEEEEVLKAFEILRRTEPSARLVLVPRHPERAVAVESLVACRWDVCRSSRIFADWDVLVVDQIGVLFDLYGVAAAAFVGGSFADKGGQNILEPAAWGLPVQYGPHMEDFAGPSAEFLRLGLSRQVGSGEELGSFWSEIAGNADKNKKYAKLSEEYFDGKSGAAQRTWDEIMRCTAENLRTEVSLGR